MSVDISDVGALLGLTSSYTDPVAPAGRVSRRLALQVPTVKRCRDLIAGTLSTLPVELFGPTHEAMAWSLMDQLEPDVPRSVTLARTFDDLLFEQVAWWRVLARGYHGFPTSVRRLEPRSVNVMKNSKVYVKANGQAQGMAWEWVPDADLIRFDSPNEALLEAGARAIRAAALINAAAERFADGVPPMAYLSPKVGEADPDDEEEDEETGKTELQELLDNWATAEKTRATPYLGSAIEHNVVGWNPEQLQMADARREASLEIARVAGVDPEDVGISTTSRTYQNSQDRRKQFTDFTLGSYRQAFEDRLSMDDVTPAGFRARMDLSAFMRSDDKTRMETWEIALRIGAMTDEEIREAEGRPALKAIAAPVQEDTMNPKLRVVHAAAQAAVTFDATEAVAFDFPGAIAESVDVEKRTITGLLVPYGKVGFSRGALWQFARGTLKWADPSRVKLWVQHNPASALGYALELDDREDGLYGTFQVDSSDEGTKALMKAKDKVLDGLSIGLGLGGKFQTRGGVNHAIAMPLMETSLTPAPVFDDARVHSVAASATEGNKKMTPAQRARLAELRATQQEANFSAFSEGEQVEFDQLTALETANPVEVQLGAGDFSAADVAGAVSAGVQAAFQTFGQPTVIPAGGVQVVSEPLPYRFDGGQAEHEFSADVAAALVDRNGEAAQRVNQFLGAAFDVATDDVNEINPVPTRSEMYVDYIEKTAPVYSAIYKGALDDATPFIVPKYSSSSNLVADHVEGEPPASDGTFVTTSQTVTPAAVSGKTEVNREVLLAGGNPRVSVLLWNQIRRAYYEAMEVKAAAVLTGSAATELGVALTPGGTGKVIGNELEGQLTSLQFIQGGSRFNRFLGHVDMYTVLVGAEEVVAAYDGTDLVEVATGRKLYPQINPSNASGQTGVKYSYIDVGGFQINPAWSLGATGVNEKSYLFCDQDVHFWNSAPLRIDWTLGVEAEVVGVFGVWGGAITRLDGVRKKTYDKTA